MQNNLNKRILQIKTRQTEDSFQASNMSFDRSNQFEQQTTPRFKDEKYQFPIETRDQSVDISSICSNNSKQSLVDQNPNLKFSDLYLSKSQDREIINNFQGAFTQYFQILNEWKNNQIALDILNLQLSRNRKQDIFTKVINDQRDYLNKSISNGKKEKKKEKEVHQTKNLKEQKKLYQMSYLFKRKQKYEKHLSPVLKAVIEYTNSDNELQMSRISTRKSSTIVQGKIICNNKRQNQSVQQKKNNETYSVYQSIYSQKIIPIYLKRFNQTENIINNQHQPSIKSKQLFQTASKRYYNIRMVNKEIKKNIFNEQGENTLFNL